MVTDLAEVLLAVFSKNPQFLLHLLLGIRGQQRVLKINVKFQRAFHSGLVLEQLIHQAECHRVFHLSDSIKCFQIIVHLFKNEEIPVVFHLGHAFLFYQEADFHGIWCAIPVYLEIFLQIAYEILEVKIVNLIVFITLVHVGIT